MNPIQAKTMQAAGAKYGASAAFGLRFGVARMLFVSPCLGGADLSEVGDEPGLTPPQVSETLISAERAAINRCAAPPPPPAVGARALASLALTPRVLAQRPAAAGACAGDSLTPALT